MSEVKVYLELSEEIQKLLADNELSIASILRHENIDVSVDYEMMPFQPEEGAKSRDLTPFLILASAGLVLSIGSAISKVLNTLKPQVVKDVTIKELLDKDGKLKSRTTVKTYKLLESERENTLKINGGKLFSIEFTDSHRKNRK